MNNIFYAKDGYVFKMDVTNPKGFDSGTEVHSSEFHSKLKTRKIYVEIKRCEDEQNND